jgi:hypothetical protein
VRIKIESFTINVICNEKPLALIEAASPDFSSGIERIAGNSSEKIL